MISIQTVCIIVAFGALMFFVLFGCVFAASKFMDWRNGIDWKTTFCDIKRAPASAAMYISTRLVVLSIMAIASMVVASICVVW